MRWICAGKVVGCPGTSWSSFGPVLGNLGVAMERSWGGLGGWGRSAERMQKCGGQVLARFWVDLKCLGPILEQSWGISGQLWHGPGWIGEWDWDYSEAIY